MTFKRWGFDFEGPFDSPNDLQSKPGVYVIWCIIGNVRSVLDVGESKNIFARVNDHKRADQWIQKCKGIIGYSATYTQGLNKNDRRFIEQNIRGIEKPPCGEF